MTAKGKWRPNIRRARILSEALPYLRQHHGRRVVVKYGGGAMANSELAEGFARDIVLLRHIGVEPIVVHGGGPQIARMLKRLGMESRFIDGLRVTDGPTMEIVEMVLAGTINKNLAAAICAAGALAVGICGKDAGLIRARKRKGVDGSEDMGFVGLPNTIDPTLLDCCLKSGLIPVIAPIGLDEEGQTFNINADTAAGAIACAIGASRLLLLTDVPGVLDENQDPVPGLTLAQARTLLRNGIVKGGMIPKLEVCIEAIEGGVDAAAILDGRLSQAILLEMFTDRGCGTLIRRAETCS